jgi:hypothetical protein
MEPIYHNRQIFTDNKWRTINLDKTKDDSYRVCVGELSISVAPTIEKAEIKLLDYFYDNKTVSEQLKNIKTNKWKRL